MTRVRPGPARGKLGALRSLAPLSALLLLACPLPPAQVDVPGESRAEADPEPRARAGDCRALVTTADDRGPRVHELRWSDAGVDHRQARGMIAGDDEGLFELRLKAHGELPDYFEVDADAAAGAIRCETQELWVRALPEGVAYPLVESVPACVGELEGERYELESDLRITSIFGPLLGYRDHAVGLGPGPISRARYRTVDLRSGEEVEAVEAFVGPLPRALAEIAELRPQLEAEGERAPVPLNLEPCAVSSGPAGYDEIEGFAIEWSERGGLRLRVGWSCCSWEDKRNICELDDDLPAAGPAFAGRLPDPDELLHSPHGCGSIGLDGKLRDRAGAVVGEHGLSREAILGVAFLPAGDPFELSWLGE